jgi:hypothetical protein
MPFDLDLTRHSFDPLPTGGALTVTARDPADIFQVRLVREHLQSAAKRFAAGDFLDPAFIHGDDMPGLAELRKGFRQIDVAFSAVEGGGRITFDAQDPSLVDAIHRWFAAQRFDHGAHARP